MRQGWKVGLTIYVFINKRFRRGRLESREGHKWKFKPERYANAVSIAPTRAKWHYDFKQECVKWRKKIKVLMLDHKPFKFQRERYLNWSGAKVGSTKPVLMTVWQLVGTSKVIVGHLGQYTMVRADGLKLLECVVKPKKFFLGRGKLNARQFRCLKLVSQYDRPKRMPRAVVRPIYKVPSRAELGPCEV